MSEILTNKTLDGMKIKSINGGDYLSARRLYQEVSSFMIHAGIFGVGNEFPEVKPDDCLESLVRYSMPIRFVEKHKLVQNNPNYKLVRPEYTSACLEIGIQDAFIDMILNSFSPVHPELPECITHDNEDNDLDDVHTQHLSIQKMKVQTNSRIYWNDRPIYTW